MSSINQLQWSFTGEELQSSRSGTCLAERYINSLADEVNIHERTELANILTAMKQQDQLTTPAAQGFISKINFALKQYAQLAA